MKVLLVDDDASALRVLTAYVKLFGHETITAANGKMALDLWHKERPRLVITDWNTPGMNGPELCQKIREEEVDAYTYILMLTANKEPEDLVRGMKAGADDYLVKPVSKDELEVRLMAAQRVLGLQSKDIIIFSLAKLSESRDTDTGNHLERIRYYSKAIGEYLQRKSRYADEIDNLFMENLFLTSPLHDIGKVGIPDYVLLKPGRLDDDEFNIMKKHTTIGYETLHDAYLKSSRTSYLETAAQIAKSHHEKFDGTGYPDGLSGEDIPLSARIVALADVYDALVSKRAYKGAYSHDRARAIIMEGYGKHFDPVVVEAFTAMENEFIRIHDEYGPEEVVQG